MRASTRPPAGALPRYLDEASVAALVADHERELSLEPEPARAVRLHHALGWLFEAGEGDGTRALSHYARALAIDAAHLPSIHAARRLMLARGATRDALPLIDAEAQAAPGTELRAALRHEQAERHEQLGELERARGAFQAALALSPERLVTLDALARLEHGASRWSELAATYENLARVLRVPRHRAAVLGARASLLEMRLENPSLAADVYESALGLDPAAASAREALDRLRHAAGRHLDRIALAELRAEDAPSAATRSLALHQVARIHAERLGNLPEAISALERALASSPDDALLLEELAQLYERAGKTVELAQVLLRLAARTPSSVTRAAMHHRVGQLFTDAGRTDDALTAYRAALALRPAHAPTLEAIEPLLRARDDDRGLLEVWSAEADAADSDARRAAAYARIGELADAKLGDAERAIAAFQRALALAPADARTFAALARLYTVARRHRELIDLHERALDAATSDPARLSHLFRIGGLWETALDDPSMALSAYRRALAIDPRHLGAIHAVQRAAETAGRHEDHVAALDLEIALEADPGRRLALANAVATVLLERKGDAHAATLRFRSVLEKSPTDATALAGLARIHRAASRWDELVLVYERELSARPDGPRAGDLLHAMGELVETKVGREELAITYYRRAVDTRAGHDPSLRALTRLLQKRGAWNDLADTLVRQSRTVEEPRASAELLYRAAAVLEERAVSRAESDRALETYRACLQKEPRYRPAIEAMSRMLDRRGEWKLLVEHLETEVGGDDPERASAMLLRQAEVLRHALSDRASSVAKYESLLDVERGRLDAIVALELLYVGQPATQAGLLARKAGIELGEAVRSATLVELARLEAVDVELGDPKSTLERALSDAPDPGALLELERLALATRDLALLARLDESLASAAPHPTLAAEHLSRRAQRLASSDPDAARTLFESALARDPESLVALRGLRGLAESGRDLLAMAEAIGREASWTRHPAHGAELLVEEARLRVAVPGQLEKTIACLERALELAPAHVVAAQEIERLLTARSVVPAAALTRAIDILGKAAAATTDVARSVSLWRTVATLQARAQDATAAIGTLRRALGASPTDVVTLDRLAAAYIRMGQWPESVPYLDRIVSLSTRPEELLSAHVRLAQAFAERVDGLDRASAELDHALKLTPDHPTALRLLVDVRRKRGDLEGARQVAQRLVGATRGTDGDALIALAHVERDRGDGARHLELLASAVAILGPSSVAHRELAAAADRPTLAKAHADALTKYLAQPTLEPSALAQGTLALARIYAERLQMGAVALRTLEEGLLRSDGDPTLAAELAQTFRSVGKLDEAVLVLERLLAQRPASAGLWRALSKVHADAGRSLEAELALAPLVLLGAATDAERALAKRREVSALELAPASLAGLALADLGDREQVTAPATRLLIALHDVIRKLHADAAGQALASRRPGRGNERTRTVAAQLGSLFGVRDFDVFVVEDEAPVASALLVDPPAIVLTTALERGPASRHTFLVARAVAALALRLDPVEALPDDALGLLLAGAGHLASPDHAIDLYELADLQEEARRIKKALPWLGSKPIAEASALHASAPPLDVAAWAHALRSTSTRLAALVTGDLTACVEALAAVFPSARGAHAAESPHARDLLLFWTSPQAVAARRKLSL